MGWRAAGRSAAIRSAAGGGPPRAAVGMAGCVLAGLLPAVLRLRGRLQIPQSGERGWICRMRSQMTTQTREERCLRLTSNCQSQPLGALQERIKTLLCNCIHCCQNLQLELSQNMFNLMQSLFLTSCNMESALCLEQTHLVMDNFLNKAAECG